MTSRIWKYLGVSAGGHSQMIYRIDRAELCVDCEHALRAEIDAAIKAEVLQIVAYRESSGTYEGAKVLWGVLPIGFLPVADVDIPRLAAGNCVLQHNTLQ